MADVDISKSGFAAISKKPPDGPLARKQLVRHPNGSVTLQYVDMNTGLPIPSLNGYNLVEASNNYMTLDDLGLNPVKEPEIDQPQSTAQRVIKSTEVGEGSDGLYPSDPRDGSFKSDPLNNYGYINKPGFMSLTNYIPGPIGTLSKVANAGVNFMNTTAVNEAKQMLGLPENSVWDTIKGTLKDQHGQIGDVKINNQQYAVGFEALDPHGRTNLTPMEARARGLTLGGITPASKQETKTAIKEFKESNVATPRGGVFSKVGATISNFIDRMFDDGNPYNNDGTQFVSDGRGGMVAVPNTGTLLDSSKGWDYFPEAPAYNSYDAGFEPSSWDYSGGSDPSSISPAAADAIASGGGGLY